MRGIFNLSISCQQCYVSTMHVWKICKWHRQHWTLPLEYTRIEWMRFIMMCSKWLEVCLKLYRYAFCWYFVIFFNDRSYIANFFINKFVQNKRGKKPDEDDNNANESVNDDDSNTQKKKRKKASKSSLATNVESQLNVEV